MKKKLFYATALLGLGLLLMSCRLISISRVTGTPVNTPPAAQPTLTAASAQSMPTAAALDQSPAGQAEQSLDNMQSTLQSVDTGGGSLDTTQIDQSLNDLQNSLQGTDVPVPTPDSIDQDLNNLQQTLQAQPTP